MDKPETLLAKLTPAEKAALLSGTDFYCTNPVPRLGIPSVRTSDGPHGLRVQKGYGDNGVTASENSTSFPTAATVACSWNAENAEKVGRALGEEANYFGVDVILGPGINIKRNPLGGRNFEYYSEDPLLAGKMGAGEVRGIQEEGVSACLKHFAANNQENYRFMNDCVCDERALREIYFKPFEIAVKEAHPDTIMCSYNMINGVYSCQNKWLLTDVLREEWGFSGLVMTDWGATHDRLRMIDAGLDLEMPGDTMICRKWILDGLEEGKLKQESLDNAVLNVLNLAQKHEGKEEGDPNFECHDLLAEEIACDCAVLLENKGALPLSKGDDLVVIGDLFEKMRYQGAGSSMSSPWRLTTPKKAFDDAGVSYAYARGYKENETSPNQLLISEALSKAEGHEKALLFAGLTDYVESEGQDRESMALPANQLSLIDALLSKGKKIILVLYGGSPIELPFREKMEAILLMYLPGQRGGEATRKLLFGEKTPSGKLAETWPASYADVPYGEAYSKKEIELYKENVYVGYRYYESRAIPVAYPFGYGLSYTRFEYSDFEVREEKESIVASFTIKNVGDRFGAEIAQIYVKSPQKSVFRPLKELKGFAKVCLEPGEAKKVTVSFAESDLAYYHVKEKRFVLEEGRYEFELSENVSSPKCVCSLHLDGEGIASPYPGEVISAYNNDPGKISDGVFENLMGQCLPKAKPKKPIRLESRFTDLRSTFFGRILFSAVLSVARNDMKKAKRMKEGPERDNKIKGAMFLKRILESNSIITMSMSAGRSFPYHFALGMRDIANGHLIRGIKDFCMKIKVPPLPKDEAKGKNKE